MSEQQEQSENNTTKIVIAVASVFIIGFVMVGANKQKTVEEMEHEAMIRNYVTLQSMANDKCPKAVFDETGEQVYFPSSTDTDKDSYITLNWEGENSATGGFKTASCTLKASIGGISKLVIDGKEIINK